MSSIENNTTINQTTNKQLLKKVHTDDISSKKDVIEFDWKNKWLKGDEYAYILSNIDLYSSAFNMPKLLHKTHPPSIYTEPENGMIYFVEGNSVGSDFGFPRVEMKKRYRWKKMNFTTDLPKKRPYVTYIVASAVKCEKFFPDSKNEGPSFRMHAVILNKEGMQTQKYKSKASPSGTHSEELQSSISTKCPSIADLNDNEKSELLTEDSIEFKKTPTKKEEKSYILCHIRKIDHNYKALKAAGKRRNSYDEDEEEEEEEVGVDEVNPSKKIVIEQKISPQQKSEEDYKSSKENSFSNPIRYDSILAPSKIEHKNNEPIPSFSSAFHTITPMFSLSSSFKEKKSEPTSSLFNAPIIKNDKPLPIDTIRKDNKPKEIKPKPEKAGQEESKNKELALMKDLYKENSENFDYFKLFNILVNFKDN